MTEVNDDILNGSVENVMKNREEYNRVAQQLVDSKLMTLYQMKCTIAEQEMTEEEFSAEMKKIAGKMYWFFNKSSFENKKVREEDFELYNNDENWQRGRILKNSKHYVSA